MTSVPSRYVVGIMTGTSIDGMDAALCRIEGRGLEMQVEVIRTHSLDFPPSLIDRLRGFADHGVAMTAGEVTEMSRSFAMLHAVAVKELLGSVEDTVSIDQINLLSVHGQTVFHAPPLSWQLFSPATLARELNVAVVCDLRAADLAAGGQGAPLTPLADWVLFRDRSVDNAETRCVINLGGFCNTTVLSPIPADANAANITLSDVSACIRGFDVCACSQLLDSVARIKLGMPYDADGLCASKGSVVEAVREMFLQKLELQATAGRSLGTTDSPAQWVESCPATAEPNDVMASAVSALAATIMKHVPDKVRAVFLAGGGARNCALRREIDALASLRGVIVCDTGDARAGGVDVAYREAACWAVLGALSSDAVPVTMSSTTKVAVPPCSGTWVMPPYPALHSAKPHLISF